MTHSNLYGPYELKAETIDKKVPKGIVGNFLLGESLTDKNGFSIFSFGSSYSDINEELKKFVGNYKHFQYSFAYSKYDTFYLDCLNHHEFKHASVNNDNYEHPEPPKGCNWFCPVCGVYGHNK